MTTVLALDHVQLLVPPGGEQPCRDFYVGMLGLRELERPPAVAGRAFLWVGVGHQQVHFRVDPDFKPAKIAHPGFLVGDIAALEKALNARGFDADRSQIAAAGRFHVYDPFGNRLEFIQQGE